MRGHPISSSSDRQQVVIEACEMMEMLAAKDYEGKVLVLGPRASPMVAAVRALGGKLGLAMLPLLPMPFSAEKIYATASRRCSMRRQRRPPSKGQRSSMRTGRSCATRRRGMRARSRSAVPLRGLRPASGAGGSAIRGIPVPQRGPSAGAPGRSRIGADFLAPHGAIEIAIELPIAFFRAPEAIAGLCRQLPDHPSFAGLIIEINAAEAVRELGLVKALAKQLRFRNIAISIKDVGDEWLPLSKLHDFPFVELKLDRRLVAGCAHDRSKLTTCRHIIDFADGMGARTVAEGVEDRGDFIAVRELGVHLVQGDLFVAATTAERFAHTVLARETKPR